MGKRKYLSIKDSESTIYSECANYCAKCWEEFTTLTEEEHEIFNILNGGLYEKVDRKRKANIKTNPFGK